MRALIRLCLPLLLTACATDVVVRDECHVNTAALEPRICPAWNGQTYRDLAEYASELKAACRVSEADKADVKQQLGGKDVKGESDGGP